MSLWDPEAAGNAAMYLRLDDMKMLEIRNAPFDGGKAGIRLSRHKIYLIFFERS